MRPRSSFAPKNVAVAMTVVWPTVTWNLALLRHLPVYHWILRTSATAECNVGTACP